MIKKAQIYENILSHVNRMLPSNENSSALASVKVLFLISLSPSLSKNMSIYKFSSTSVFFTVFI